jgi:nucleoside-diphosphate kinase
LLSITSAARSFHTAANAESVAKKYLTLGGATLLTAYGMYSYQSHAVSAAEKTLPLHGNAGTNEERTFIAIKPDGVQRGLISEVIARYAQE